MWALGIGRGSDRLEGADNCNNSEAKRAVPQKKIFNPAQHPGLWRVHAHGPPTLSLL